MTRAPSARVAVLTAALALALAPAAGAGMKEGGSWGSEGSGNGQFGTGQEAQGGNRQFNSPGGITVSGGHVLVADTSNNRIERFGPTGVFQSKFGAAGFNFDPGSKQLGSSRRGFLLPQGIATDSSGNVFIADNRNDRLVKWSAGGRFLKRITRRGSIGSQTTSPWGVAVAGSTVYVVDQGNFKIKRFSTGGAFRGAFGSFGLGRAGLRAPYGVAADRKGDVYVSDTIRDQVLKFTSGGRLQAVFGSPGSGPGQFDQPAGLALDAKGNLLVADCANQRIQRLSPSGSHLDTFGVGSLQDPTFVASGPGGHVYVSDFRRVVRFDPTSQSSPRGDSPGPPGRLACTSQAEGA
jgi:tripartite motif-containing protein 71